MAGTDDGRYERLRTIDHDQTVHEKRRRPAGEAVGYPELARHVGHLIVCVAYAGGVNVAIECEDCAEVIHDRDRPVAPEPTPGAGDDLPLDGRPLPILARLRRASGRGSPAEGAGRDQEV